MAYNREGTNSITPRLAVLPRADEVEACPPHYWRLEAGWQQCKKCELREKTKQLDNYQGWPPRRPKSDVAD